MAKYQLLFHKDFPKDLPILQKTLKQLTNGYFQNVKIINGKFSRIKVDKSNRILFKFHHKQRKVILVLEYIEKHNYSISKFLRGKPINESEFYIPKQNKTPQTQHKDNGDNKKLSQLTHQNRSTILKGCTGCGKTQALINQICNFAKLHKKIIYVSHSKNLIKSVQEQYRSLQCPYNSRIKFQTFNDLINISNYVDFRKFQDFAFRYKLKDKDIEKYYEEFHGVITAVHNKPYLSRDEYLKLGKNEAVFPKSNRNHVYDVFEKYLEYLDKNRLIDQNIYISSKLNIAQTQNRFHLVIIDDVQNFTTAQIKFLTELGEYYILSGDTHQMVNLTFFSWTKIKNLFQIGKDEDSVIVFENSYRIPTKIVDVANKLLDIKQSRFNLTDKETSISINSISDKPGNIYFFKRDKVNEIKKEIQHKKNIVIIAFDKRMKMEAKIFFEHKILDTPNILTIQDVQGLEYDNVVLFNFVSANKKVFDQTINRSQYIPSTMYINALYLAITRSKKNLYIVENDYHRIWELLGIVKQRKKRDVKSKSSNDIQRNQQYKQQPISTNLQPIKKNRERLDEKQYFEQLYKNVFSDKSNPNMKQRLFKHAKKLQKIDVIKKMADELDYKQARIYIYGNIEKEDTTETVTDNTTTNKELLNNIDNFDTTSIKRILKNYNEKDIDIFDKPHNISTGKWSSPHFRQQVHDRALKVKNLLIAMIQILLEENSNLDITPIFEYAKNNNHNDVISTLQKFME